MEIKLYLYNANYERIRFDLFIFMTNNLNKLV